MRLLGRLLIVACVASAGVTWAKGHKSEKKGTPTATPGAATPAAAPVAGGPNQGTLTLVCPTPGAEIYVDNKKIGTMPDTPVPMVVPLNAGEHAIKVTKPGFAPVIDVFTIQKRKDNKLDVELVPVSGVARVSANVDKARVFVDGRFMCEAPCVADLGVGARAVQVSKGGFKDFFQNVSAVAGQEMVLDVKLEELPMGLNPYKPPPPPPPKWYEKWWVWTVGVVGVAVLVTAIAAPVAVSQQDPVAGFGATYNFTIKLK